MNCCCGNNIYFPPLDNCIWNNSNDVRDDPKKLALAKAEALRLYWPHNINQQELPEPTFTMIKKLPCLVCGETFKTLSTLKRH